MTMAYAQNLKLNLIKFQNQHKNFKTSLFAIICIRTILELFIYIVNNYHFSL